LWIVVRKKGRGCWSPGLCFAAPERREEAPGVTSKESGGEAALYDERPRCLSLCGYADRRGCFRLTRPLSRPVAALDSVGVYEKVRLFLPGQRPGIRETQFGRRYRCSPAFANVRVIRTWLCQPRRQPCEFDQCFDPSVGAFGCLATRYGSLAVPLCWLRIRGRVAAARSSCCCCR
jgi:hypothetical protein